MAEQQGSILKKILLSGRHRWLLAGALLGAFLGFLLLILSAQFYLDLQKLLSGEGTDQYVQINKKINVFNTIGVKATFTTPEMDEIKAQPFILDVGTFTSNDFKVGAYSDMLGFYSELFFESIPDRFLDVDEPGFRWSEGQRKVPILISRDYLALYNFGFAPSQGLPQLSTSSVKKMSMNLKISGPVGKEQVFEGQVVGFSDRVNSILVPPSFLEWANKNFGNGNEREPSRLFLKVVNPMSPEFQNFLKEKGFETSSGRLIGGQFVSLFNLVVGAVAVLGLLLLVLATVIFLLVYQLVIARNAAEIKLLLQIGYTPKVVGLVLAKRFLTILISVMVSAFAVGLLIRYFLSTRFAEQGFDISTGLDIDTWALTLFLGLILIWLNLRSIRSNVTSLGAA